MDDFSAFKRVPPPDDFSAFKRVSPPDDFSGVLPGLDHGHQLVANRAGPVVVLDRAADVDAAGGDFDADLLDPAGVHGLQARQAARLLHGRVEHFLLEAVVVQLDHFDLQPRFFARREDSGLGE